MVWIQFERRVHDADGGNCTVLDGTVAIFTEYT